MASARINARIDDEIAEKLAAVQRATKKTTTEVLRAAIVRAYEEHVGDAGANVVRDAFSASGFIGCADGPSDLATNAKRYLAESLEAKTGARSPRPRRARKKK